MIMSSTRRSMMRLCVLASACFMVLISCSEERNVSIAQSAVDELHNLLKAQADEVIYAEATVEFQKSMDAAASRAFFERIRRNLGAPHVSRLISIRVNHMPAGTFLVCQFQTSFDKGDAQENVTWRLQNGKPRLVGYYLRSPLLLTD